MSYRNVDNWEVILIDGVRDAEVSWVEHRRRSSLGGVDCVALDPKPIHAPTDGRVDFVFNNGTGGHTATVTAEDGWQDQFLHLSAFEGISGRAVAQGDLIGFTGSTVARGLPPVAPHLHWHRIDPTGFHADVFGSTDRRNPWHFFDGAGLAVAIEEISEDIMTLPTPLHQVNSDGNQAFLAITGTHIQHISRDFLVRLVAMRGETIEDVKRIDEHGRNVLNVTLGNAREAMKRDIEKIVAKALKDSK